jgi:hypothetical protein
MTSYTTHISKPEKQDSPVSQTEGSDFACNSYILNSGCSSFKTGYSGFYWLVFNG